MSDQTNITIENLRKKVESAHPVMVRWAGVVEIGEAFGVSHSTLRRMKEAGTITGKVLTGGTRPYYYRDEVIEKTAG